MPSQYGPVAVNVGTGALEYAAGSVGSSQITDASIATADLADGAVTAAKQTGLAVLAAAQTFTEDQTIESGNKLWFDVGDVNLYRGNPNILKTDDNLHLSGGTLYMGASADVTLSRFAAGVLNSDSAVQFTEQADASAGAANTARLYAKDNGSGKTQLVVRFASGAVQVIATEP